MCRNDRGCIFTAGSEASGVYGQPVWIFIESSGRKKSGILRRELKEAQNILQMTGRGNRFSFICAVALALFCAGGSIAILLGNFFLAPVMAVGFLGGNAGKFIEEGLEAQGVLCCFTRIAGDTRTNSNIMTGDGRVTELLEPGPEISEKELENFRKQFRGCLEQCEWVILSGSVPGGVPADIYRELIEECHAFGCRVILDSSGEALRQGIPAKPDLVKPNRKELEYLAGEPLDTEEKIKKAMRQLCDKTGGEVVVSLGVEGLFAMAAGQNSGFWKQDARRVEAVNTVGCGKPPFSFLPNLRVS